MHADSERLTSSIRNFIKLGQICFESSIYFESMYNNEKKIRIIFPAYRIFYKNDGNK
jgi:hypothetical protein